MGIMGWEIDHYEVGICRSNGLTYNYVCHSEEEVEAYLEAYGEQVCSIKKISKAIW